jgi:hypothetical protein
MSYPFSLFAIEIQLMMSLFVEIIYLKINWHVHLSGVSSEYDQRGEGPKPLFASTLPKIDTVVLNTFAIYQYI